MTPPAPDLLVQGDDAPARRLARPQRAVALAVAAVILAAGGAVAVARSDGPASPDAGDPDVLRLSLSPGQDRAPRYGPRRPGVHVVVANDGPADVELVGAGLLPGSWRTGVPERRRLRTGRSTVVELVPPAGCTAERPRLLQVRARLASGRTASASLDLTDAALAYGGRLEDALVASALTCDPRVPPPPDPRTYPHRS